MKRVVEAVDKNNASKLVKIVKLYERDSKRDAKKFKKQVVETVGQFIDTYISEAVDQKDIAQAVKNKTAFNVLENLRSVLGVDVAMMNKSIKGAVMDGADKINTLQTEKY
jgi:flagellar biosynthesis regulator FlbT